MYICDHCGEEIRSSASIKRDKIYHIKCCEIIERKLLKKLRFKEKYPNLNASNCECYEEQLDEFFAKYPEGFAVIGSTCEGDGIDFDMINEPALMTLDGVRNIIIEVLKDPSNMTYQKGQIDYVIHKGEYIRFTVVNEPVVIFNEETIMNAILGNDL